MLNGLCALAASSLLPYGRRIDPVNRPFEPAGKALKLAKPAAPDSPSSNLSVRSLHCKK
jgi:hypothetical protein